MQIKAEIVQPKEGDMVAANSNVRVHGAAWTGDGEITKVECSIDGGSPWNEAKLLGKPKPNAWPLWALEWKTPTPSGKAQLIPRAAPSNPPAPPAPRAPGPRTL